MPLYDDSEKKWAALLPVLDEYSDWFGTIVRQGFYPLEAGESYSLQAPGSFNKWLDSAKLDDAMQSEMLDKLFSLHADLLKAAEMVVTSGKVEQVKPSYAVFSVFLTLYEEFKHHIRRLEKDFMQENTGYDAFTGLRNKNLMYADIGREMHRLARQGKKFSIALARVDDFEQIKKNYQPEVQRRFIKLVADLIKLSVRSFDDAYYIGEDEFVLSLKQADLSGGISALERLRKELERQNVVLRLGNEERPLSLSCCIAEPVTGDDVAELIQNLKADLKVTGRASDAVLQFFELSPLQRYVQETNQRAE